jgi:hypothetical protein
MTPQTLSFTSVPPPTEGPSHLPRPGTYTATPDRCVAELTTLLAGLPTSRARLTPTGAVLTVTEDATACRLDLALDARSLDAGSLTTGRPLLSRRLRGPKGLDAGRHRRLAFHGGQIEAAGEDANGDERLIVAGKLSLRGRPVAATLRLRVVERGPDRLLALGRVFLPYRAVRAATGFTLPPTVPARLLRLVVAVEFTPRGSA